MGLLRQAHRALIDAVNRMGWIVARTSDYYSPLRPVSELQRHVARWHRPSRLQGVSFDLDDMTATLEELTASYLAEYSELPAYDEIKRQRRGPGFTIVDAMVLYMMLRRHRPARYLEVGSGLSTYYASLAAAKNAAEGRPMRMTVVDPFVSEATRALPGLEVLAREAQDLPAESYTERLEAGDVLFIDSTHIVRIDGEVPHLVLEVLPSLKPGVLIHVHDVHFPYNVPADPAAYVFDRRWPMLFTEAMLVQAWLCHNPGVEIVLSTPLLRHHREEVLKRLLPGYKPLDSKDFDTHHGSLWVRIGPHP
ncbi:MAG TPA: class I SAM-dependent methyltransferase [Thermoanaerobaculia bacterium]|jgi:predicted O-methyltransferase YrrM|nr:class I SAM-dependent methyltransferase [Thermoanaerobaculia bacterium]